MILSDWAWALVGLLLTMMILSYLIGDNFFFRLAAHIFIGITAGYFVVLILNQIVWPYLLDPLISGTWNERLWLIIPLFLSVLLFLSQFPRFTHLGRIPLAYLAGILAALTIGGAVFGTLIPQTRVVVEAFDSRHWVAPMEENGLQLLDAAVMLIGTVCTLGYFHFGRKLRTNAGPETAERPVVLEIMSKIGEVFIGIALGAVFASVFSSALFALIERIFFIGQFIIRLSGGG